MKQMTGKSKMNRLPLKGITATAFSAVLFAVAWGQGPGQNDPSRSERIRQNQERVQKLLTEAKAKREAAATEAVKAIQPGAQQNIQSNAGATPQAAPAANTPGAQPQQPPAAVPATGVAPGQPIPTGPVQPVRATPPIQAGQTPPPAAAPQAPRSESRMVFLFNPLDSAVRAGETFETNVVVESREGQIDEISFFIKYPPEKLNPLALNHSNLDPFVEHSLDYEFDPENGTIYLHAKLSEPTKFSQTPITSITWEALNPDKGAIISYEFGKERSTSLKLNGQDLIGTLPGANDGVINTTVLIKSPVSRASITKLGNGEAIISTGGFGKNLKTDKLDIYLEGPGTSVEANQEFPVHLNLDNPGNNPFDRIRAYVQFNPNDLEVLDTDKGNSIKKGINIQNSFAQGNFDFNYHRTNSADNQKGIIEYDMASVGVPLTGNGRFATIWFKAKREVSPTNIVLVANSPGLSPTTDVAYHRISLLADKPEKATAIDGIPLTVSGTLTRDEEAQQAANSAQSGYNPFRSELARRIQKNQQ